MAPHNQPKPCKLLILPAELRNRIYRYTLCAPNRIEVKENWKQYPKSYRVTLFNLPHDWDHYPNLLRTNKQIRSEAASIYYLENSFTIYAIGFDPSALLAFEAAARKHVKVAKINYAVVTREHDHQDPSQSCLQRWLKAYHDGIIRPLNKKFEPGQEFPGEHYMVAVRTFEVVDSLKGRVGWHKIEKVLDIFLDATCYSMAWMP